MDVPDLTEYRLHRVAEQACVDGVPMAGLSAAFYRRTAPEGERSVGVYRFAGAEVLQAWGYVNEPHCRAHRVRQPDGKWGEALPGCPRVRAATPADPPALRAASGTWLPLAPAPHAR
ncbi:hypothetical protein [Luedemannella helvata]|uniref:Uncharacterized protein n=1 Tax=Luedemannella helvata TaxID=349315 RepID=A0ABP4W335_9ACTN